MGPHPVLRPEFRPDQPLPDLQGHNAVRYTFTVIQGFADPEAELIWSGRRSRKLPPKIQNVAFKKNCAF
jgi:hypothetical protein